MVDPHSRQRPLPEAEYLELESASPVKHEYVAGEIYAMSGVTTRHNLVAGNIYTHLRAAARKGPCRVYVSDVKLRVTDAYYYPDVMVECTPGASPSLFIEMPCLLVEVTSPTTALVDRREKLVAYRRIPSLQAYLLVEQDRRHVTRHGRDTNGEWGFTVITERGLVGVPSPQCELSLDVIYEDVTMPPIGVAEQAEALT